MFDEKLTAKQKEQIVEYLMRCYRKSSNRIRRYETLNSVQENKAVYQYDQTTCMLVEDALNELNPQMKRIIVNDFMHPLEGKWYLEYYSRSSYLRLRAQAVDEFLRCLHA